MSCGWSTASTTCSATARWCACRRTGTRAGHQSLRVRLDSGDVVLAADACYFCRTLRERRLPRHVHDRAAMLASLDRLEALERGGARIVFGHDPEFWQSVPQAPDIDHGSSVTRLRAIAWTARYASIARSSG